MTLQKNSKKLFKIMLLVIFAATIAFYYLLIRPYDYWKKRGVRQGKPWILLGDSWGMVLRRMNLAEVVSYPYKLIPNVRYYGIYQFLKPKLVICDPELIKNITIKDFDHFTDHVAMVDPKADPLFAKNLLGLRGDEWRKMRSTLTGSFTSSKMKIMFNLISEAAENYAQYFVDQGEKQIVDVEMKDAFTRFTIDIIATTSFGVKVDSLKERNNEFFQMGKEITDLNLGAFLKVMLFQAAAKVYRFFNFRFFKKEVSEFFTTLINDTIRTREERGIYRPDMLQILMEARKGIVKEEDHVDEVGFAVTKEYLGKLNVPHEITNEDITAQAVIFFFAGFDSVSSLMTFTSYELAMNQYIQDKLRREINETLKTCPNGKVTYEAVANMKYMDMVISESLRKWPPFVLLGRECTKTYVIEPTSPEEKTLVIPKGMGVQMPLYAIHHDPKYYPDPEKFDPERFSPENRNKLVPHTFLGFGKGPRGCLGSRFALLEVKIIFFHLLRRLKLVTTEKTQIPVQLSKKFAINIRPEKGVWLGLQKLN